MSNNYLGLTTMIGQVLVNARIAAAAATAVYTCPANTTVKLASASLSNSTGAPVGVSVSLLKSGDTADSTHQLIPSFTVPASGDPDSGGAISLKDFLAGVMLGPGDSISVTPAATNAVAVFLTGAVSS